MPPVHGDWNTGAYGIQHRASGKIYVGGAYKSFSARLGGHRRQLRNGVHPNRHLQNAWNKFGETAFRFCVLERCSPGEVKGCEQRWMDLYDATNPNKGYNKSPTAGSPLGYKHTEETKRKVSRAHTGLKFSDEHRLNMSLAKLAMSDETRSKMSRYARNRSESHLRKLSESSKGNKKSVGRILSIEARASIAAKAKARWQAWRESGKVVEIGKAISNGQRRVRNESS